MTYPVTNRSIHKDPVTVDTTATDLLTAAEQSTLNMCSVFVLPDVDVYVGGPGVTAANAARLCPANTTTEIVHYAGPLKAIVASGSASVRVEIGCR